jgi:hypothetical protein
MNKRQTIPNLPGKLMCGRSVVSIAKLLHGLQMGTKDFSIIARSVRMSTIESHSEAETASMMVSEYFTPFLPATEKSKIGSDGLITLLKTFWRPWWTKCYGRKTDQIPRHYGAKRKWFCPGQNNQCQQIFQTRLSNRVLAKVNFVSLPVSPSLRNLYPQPHTLYLGNCLPLQSKTRCLMLNDGARRLAHHTTCHGEVVMQAASCPVQPRPVESRTFLA